MTSEESDFLRRKQISLRGLPEIGSVKEVINSFNRSEMLQISNMFNRIVNFSSVAIFSTNTLPKYYEGYQIRNLMFRIIHTLGQVCSLLTSLQFTYKFVVYLQVFSLLTTLQVCSLLTSLQFTHSQSSAYSQSAAIT